MQKRSIVYNCAGQHPQFKSADKILQFTALDLKVLQNMS